MSNSQMIFDKETIAAIYECDVLFADQDQNGDCQLSMMEFEAYVRKRAGDEKDVQSVMKEFKEIDVNNDGYIQFLEFFRAICKKKNVHLPSEINVYDKLQIYEIIQWKHITVKEKAELTAELKEMQDKIPGMLVAPLEQFHIRFAGLRLAT